MTEAAFHLIANHIMDIYDQLSEKIIDLPAYKRPFTLVPIPGEKPPLVKELLPLLGIIKTIHQITNTHWPQEERTPPPLLLREGELPEDQ